MESISKNTPKKKFQTGARAGAGSAFGVLEFKLSTTCSILVLYKYGDSTVCAIFYCNVIYLVVMSRCHVHDKNEILRRND